jgi:hypothetical protein
MSQKKGAFLIKNSEGTVAINGLTTLTNDVIQLGWRDITEIFMHNDAGNVPRALTKDYNAFELTGTIQPGIGSALADQAAVKAAVASLRRGMQVILGAFEDSDFVVPDADKAILWEVGKDLSQGGIFAVSITLRKFTTTAGVVIDFTGAWADL